ncbi:putative secreted protein [Corynebacterium resistens DSM 45100]|uniref:Secreted protein n=1 Tax=Corynebacterium resistens (strain DSM 45100 / JCM 12819 / GTC 2026 / SICGH 158) TaxID=662755 RepID=F8E025_CORRG|nr:hypothetical protein [Corynebacterium resistens]AEI09164.1 putative secreted protein [Corynebacterium resistens DSM 45100]
MRKKALAVALSLATTLTMTACGGDKDSEKSTSSSTAASSSAAPKQQTPTAAELTQVLNRAVDPNLPTEQKTDTVVGGEKAPQLFTALTKSREESKAQLKVVDPVLPSLTPGNVNATVTLTLPQQQPNNISNVEFVNEGGKWKLDQKWACTLVENVLPDQVPPMCKKGN